MRSQLVFVSALVASLISAPVLAHDPSMHEPTPAAKSMPKATTCKELADKSRYSSDVSDADIKALKAKCDAEKKAADKAAAKRS